jgi:hypothetical protein
VSNHRFGVTEAIKRGYETIAYTRCQDCGAVTFTEGESDYFNMACSENRNDRDRENLRNQLEKGYKVEK